MHSLSQAWKFHTSDNMSVAGDMSLECEKFYSRIAEMI